MKVCSKFGYRWNWRSQDTIGVQVYNWTAIYWKEELYTWYCLLTRGETERQDAQQHVHQEPENLPHSGHEPQHVNWCTLDPICAKSRSQVLFVMFCTPHRGSSPSCAHLSCHPCMQWALLFDFELSIPTNFFFFLFIFNLLQFLLHFFHNLKGSSNTAYFAKKMESHDESYHHKVDGAFADCAYATGPPTIAVTWNHPEELGWRL